MKVYMYSEARQKLAQLLDEAWSQGSVQIRRRDGQSFVVQPARSGSSPLDVPGIATDLTANEILGFIEEGRRPTEDPL